MIFRLIFQNSVCEFPKANLLQMSGAYVNIFTYHVYAIGRVTCGVCGLWRHPSNFDKGDDVTGV